MSEPEIIALASVIEALAGAVDPTGGARDRMCATLARALEIAAATGRESEAASIIMNILNHMESKNV
jgi:hypothetical protein